VKHLKDRRVCCLTFRTYELLEFLQRQGRLPPELCGPDVGAVGVEWLPCQDRVTIRLEGDSLPEKYAYSGHPEYLDVGLGPRRGEPLT
jgi:hypothetical protein